MAFKTPKTWVTGEIVTAPQLNEEIKDQLNSIWVGTSNGDLEYYTSGSTKQRIPVGSEGRVLKVVGGVPAWASTAMIGCKISNSSAQTISPDTDTYISAYNTEEYDSNSFHSSTNGQITIPAGQAGWYMIGASGYFGKVADNDRSRTLMIRVNTTYVVRQMTTQDTNSVLNPTDVYLTATTMVYLNASDYLRVYVNHHSEGNLTWNNSVLWILKVG